jgi:4-hydroxybenzoate polyprenyltransferase
METLKKYLSLIKFSHTIFAMPFALLGFFLGIIRIEETIVPGNSSYLQDSRFYRLLALIIGCMVFARSAAMAFNRYLDRQFDARNPRTAIREIPAGLIRANQALVFTIVCCAAFMICCWFINRICFFLSPVALFVILFYSFTKRFTALCHLVLGLGLSLAPIGAYLAVTGVFHWLPILFSLAVLCWVSGFDIIYALQDEEFDRAHQLHSIPVALGSVRALLVSRVLHTISGAAILLAGYAGSFGWGYWLGALVFCSLLIRQHLIVSPNDLSRVNMAFFTLNGIASMVFGFLAIVDMIF